mmetsp:Transcript_6942/g.13603  ORF Transcript_6942/g.13603 Transcript_6942/m.13603 type:complete len:224 (-) Transcript_6942:19-690(-)
MQHAKRQLEFAVLIVDCFKGAEGLGAYVICTVVEGQRERRVRAIITHYRAALGACAGLPFPRPSCLTRISSGSHGRTVHRVGLRITVTFGPFGLCRFRFRPLISSPEFAQEDIHILAFQPRLFCNLSSSPRLFHTLMLHTLLRRPTFDGVGERGAPFHSLGIPPIRTVRTLRCLIAYYVNFDRIHRIFLGRLCILPSRVLGRGRVGSLLRGVCVARHHFFWGF